MRCLECGSEAVTERPERTAQGYRRFRCRACGKQFNERSGTVLNRTQLSANGMYEAAQSIGVDHVPAGVYSGVMLYLRAIA